MIPAQTFMFLVVISYATIAPLMSVLGLLYFFSMYVSTKFNLLYVAEQNWDSGGLFFTSAFTHLCIAMEVYLVTMIGVFLGAGAIFGTVVSILCAIAIAFYWYYMRMEWYPLAYFGNIYPHAIKVHKSLLEDQFIYSYMHPALKPIPQDEMEKLVFHEQFREQINLDYTDVEKNTQGGYDDLDNEMKGQGYEVDVLTNPAYERI